MSRALQLGVLALVGLAARPALACGGMFCDAVQPVDQAAERIVFSFDGTRIDTEVQITYQGEASDFAWVVPVPAEPELYVSNDAFFSQLANATIPSYTLQSTATWYTRSCAGLTEVDPPELGSRADSGAVAYETNDTADTGDDGAIHVVSTQTVGPYDTVVLKATDGDVLVQWLQDQGYSLPDKLADVVEPYVNENQYFVALKLSSDKTAGDLTPLGLRYAASAASIPLQLTSVAAVPDLPIEVFVLGNARAVPDNYLHVQLNEAAFDWYGGSANYRTVVAKAADEAGGQAFATDFVGPVRNVAVQLLTPGEPTLAALRTEPSPLVWLSLAAGNTTPSAQLTAVLLQWVPPPAGVSATDFLACPECYQETYSLPEWDPAAATDALVAGVIAPMEAQTARLTRASTLTRLFTTIDPAEMTVDPVFVLNADLPQEVGLVHTATDHVTYVDGVVTERTLEAGGITYTLPDAAVPSTEGIDTPAAMIIEDLGATGTGSAIFDGTAAAKAAATPDDTGCGAKATAGAAAPLLLVAAGLLRRRRR